MIDIIKLPAKNPYIDYSFLQLKYLKEDFSSKEIAALTFSSRTKITKALKTNCIPIKRITRKETGGHVFGYKKYGGKCIKLKKEQKIIELIKSYRRQGYSYQKISENFNHNQISTKQKGIWYPKVVRQIYIRDRDFVDMHT